MSFGPVAVYSDTITSGASTSGGIALKRAFSSVSVQVSTMSTQAAIAVQGSSDGGTTYFQIFNLQANTASVANNAITIASGVGTNGGICLIPGGFNAYRFITSDVVSGGVNFKVICSSP